LVSVSVCRSLLLPLPLSESLADLRREINPIVSGQRSSCDTRRKILSRQDYGIPHPGPAPAPNVSSCAMAYLCPCHASEPKPRDWDWDWDWILAPLSKLMLRNVQYV
jgi:hypothetical protein